jgi:hypothetical protein
MKPGLHVIHPYGETSFLQYVRFGEPSSMSRGGHMINIFDDNGKKLAFQTPRLRVPFGMSDYDGKLSMTLSLADQPEFESFLRQCDAYVLERVAERSPTWFGAAAPTSANFNSNVREGAHERFAATWRLPIPSYAGSCSVDVFDTDREIASIHDVTKGCDIVALVEMSSLWFVDQRFGIKWKPLQIMVHKPAAPAVEATKQGGENTYTYMFVDE